MSRVEWAEVVAYLSAGVGKPMGREQAEVYYSLLADLPAETVRRAAARSLIEGRYPTLPPVGTLRALAVEMQAPPGPAWPEAWALAVEAVARFGLHRAAKAMASLPQAVRAAVAAIGWQALCDAAPGDLGTLRAQFRDAYSTLSARDERDRLLPEAMRDEVKALAAPIGLLPWPGREGGL